jgi:predicted MPP superfamily phosphohydrolase
MKRLIPFIAVVQAILLLVHLLLYETWIYAWPGALHSNALLWCRLATAILSVSFVSASLLAFRFFNPVVRFFYRLAAVWLGVLSFLFFAACLSWGVLAAAVLAGASVDAHRMVEILFAVATLLALAAVVNAGWPRVKRVGVRLENLPHSWLGRKAALISDLHLGHVRNGRFLRRIAALVMGQQPDAIFIAGDLYDGTAIDAPHAAEPLRQLQAPLGTYFVAGNHEQFSDDSRYLQAVALAGVRVLHNEKVELDGLQLVGVPYRHASHDEHFRRVLAGLGLNPGRASILLTHAPDRPAVAAEAGFSLQLSGHTHVGQFYPWTWMARRIYRQFVHGLSRIGKMQVYTSSGVGTWGPPLRLGSTPEIVILEFV